MDIKKLTGLSLLASTFPETAYARDGAVILLLYGGLPCVALFLCFIIETFGASLLRKLNLWRALKAFFFANLIALIALVITLIGISILFQYLEITGKYLLAAPIIATLIALKVKFSISQRNLRLPSKELMKLFLLSHPLALLAFYLAYTNYLQHK